MLRSHESGNTWLKVCGLRYQRDVAFCIESGVSCVGILVGKTRRAASELDILCWEDARAIAMLARHTETAASLLCHTRAIDQLLASIEFIGPDMVQLQFSYDVEVVAAIAKAFPSVNIIQTVRVGLDSDKTGVSKEVQAVGLNKTVSAVILDSPRGGSGNSIDWSIAKHVVTTQDDQNIILAGGIRPDNILRAIETVGPFGIDVMTGARIQRGELDHAGVARLVAATQTANRTKMAND